MDKDSKIKIIYTTLNYITQELLLSVKLLTKQIIHYRLSLKCFKSLCNNLFLLQIIEYKQLQIGTIKIIYFHS